MKLVNPILAVLFSLLVFVCGGGGGDVEDPQFISITQPHKLTPELNRFREIHDEYNLDLAEFGEFVDFEPPAEIRCEKESATGFNQAVEHLGNFVRPYKIQLERDVTVPNLWTGVPAFATYAADGAAGPSIKRPDRVGRIGNDAFFLSETLGLVTVALNEADPAQSELKCAYQLPGRPKNFFIQDTKLVVIANSLDTRNGALLQFEVHGDGLRFDQAVLLPDEQITDARLFNETLVVYSKHHRPIETGPSASKKKAVRDSMPEFLGYETIAQNIRFYSYHDLAEQAKDVYETEPFPEVGDPEATTNHYQANDFLSASGNFLVLSKKRTERVFSHYETKRYSVCEDWQIVPFSYRSCRTKWKRVANPKYQAPNASGVHQCGGDLYTCLENVVPRVNRYIRVPNGRVCRTVNSNRYNCLKRVYKSYQLPKYNYNKYTSFVVYRFEAGSFLKLDETLSVLDGADIVAEDEVLTIPGHVEKHNQMYFRGDSFFAVSDDGNLYSLFIKGNSVVKLAATSLGHSDISRLTTKFTDDVLYLGSSSYNYQAKYQTSTLNTVDITEPADPSLENTITLPTVLNQLEILEDAMIGLGRTPINVSGTIYSFGTFTQFSTAGDETDSWLFGRDYQSFTSPYDDQTVNFDHSLGRVLVPYTVNRPFDPSLPARLNRLSLLDYSTGSFFEQATFSLPEPVIRTLSVAEDFTISFSDNVATSLIKSSEWQKQELMLFEAPKSIYPARGHEYLVRLYEDTNQFKLELVGDRKVQSINVLDTVNIDKVWPNYCTYQKVYFDRDIVLITSDVPGLYTDYEDCWDGHDEFMLRGYKITANGFVEASQSRLAEVYARIHDEIDCVLDPNNAEGERIRYPESIPDSAVCRSREDWEAERE